MKNNAPVDLYRSFVISNIDFKPLECEKLNFEVKFTITLNPYELVSINKDTERYPINFDYITCYIPNSDKFFEELWSEIINALVPIHNSKRTSLIIKINKYTQEMDNDDYTEDNMYGLSKFFDTQRFSELLEEKFGNEWFFHVPIDTPENTHDFIMVFPVSMTNLFEAASVAPTMLH